MTDRKPSPPAVEPSSGERGNAAAGAGEAGVATRAASPSSPPGGWTWDELVSCVERELRFRAHVYPNRVLAKKMSAQTAEREQSQMRAILDHLKAEREKACPTLL